MEPSRIFMEVRGTRILGDKQIYSPSLGEEKKKQQQHIFGAVLTGGIQLNFCLCLGSERRQRADTPNLFEVMQDSTAKIVIFAVFKTMEFVISFLNASAGPVEKVWKATAKISLQLPHPRPWAAVSSAGNSSKPSCKWPIKKDLVRGTLTCQGCSGTRIPSGPPRVTLPRMMYFPCLF